MCTMVKNSHCQHGVANEVMVWLMRYPEVLMICGPYKVITTHQQVLTFTFDNHVNLAFPGTICFYWSYPVFFVYFCLINKIINNLSAIFKTGILLFISIICVYCICQKNKKELLFSFVKKILFLKKKQSVGMQ